MKGLLDTNTALPADSPLLAPAAKKRPLMASIVGLSNDPQKAVVPPNLSVKPTKPVEQTKEIVERQTAEPTPKAGVGNGIRPTTSFAAIEQRFFKLALKLKLKGASYAVGLFIYRHTIGFDRLSSGLSESYLAKGTGYSTKQVNRVLKGLCAIGLIKIEISSKNPWRDPRIIHINHDLIKSIDDENLQPNTTPDKMSTVDILSTQDITSGPDNLSADILSTKKNNNFKKNNLSPLIPPVGGGEGLKISEEELLETEKILTNFYRQMNWRSVTDRIRQNDLSTLMGWHITDGFSFNVIEKAVEQVARMEDTKSITRAEYYLAPAEKLLSKKNSEKQITVELSKNHDEEIRLKNERVEKLDRIKATLKPGEWEARLQETLELIRSENPTMPVFLLETLARQDLNHKLVQEKEG